MNDHATTILVAEDSRFLRKATELILAKAGYAILTAADGEETLELARTHQPDLILLDLMMPKLNGVEVIRLLKRDIKTARIPVVVLTGLSQQNDRNLVHAGATAYYEKSKLIPDALISIVKEGLAANSSNPLRPAVDASSSCACIEETTRETLRVSKNDDREYERQMFEQVVSVNNELLAAQRQLAQANDELRRIASTDDVTGLANRRKTTEDLNRLISLARRQKQSLCVGIIDLDKFKSVNDRFGHAAGDVVLRSLGGLLLNHFRSEDVVGRWGGEEFIVGLYGCSLRQATNRLEELRRQFSGKRFAFGDELGIELTLSAGVAVFPDAGSDLERLCHSADTAMYAAKGCGRNSVVSVGKAQQLATAVVTDSYAAIRIVS